MKSMVVKYMVLFAVLFVNAAFSDAFFIESVTNKIKESMPTIEVKAQHTQSGEGKKEVKQQATKVIEVEKSNSTKKDAGFYGNSKDVKPTKSYDEKVKEDIKESDNSKGKTNIKKHDYKIKQVEYSVKEINDTDSEKTSKKSIQNEIKNNKDKLTSLIQSSIPIQTITKIQKTSEYTESLYKIYLLLEKYKNDNKVENDIKKLEGHISYLKSLKSKMRDALIKYLLSINNEAKERYKNDISDIWNEILQEIEISKNLSEKIINILTK